MVMDKQGAQIDENPRKPREGFPTRLIPTTDAEAALAFCQDLAKFLDGRETAGGNHAGLVHRPRNTFQPAVEPTPAPVFSIVLPVFEEEANLVLLYQRLRAVMDDVGEPFEIVFVDDGSQDASPQLIEAMIEEDPRVKLVGLARNFGHQVAISAGMDHARGEAVIIMDADLQDPPEVVPDFIAKWRAGYEVVYAIRAKRKEGLLKRTAYAVFYRLLHSISNIEIPLDAGDFCLMDRKVVDVLVNMPERNRFVRGIRSWVGLRQIGLSYERDTRYAGLPKYTFNRLMYLALDGLVSFSYIPLRIITILGFSVSLVSILLAIFYTVKKLTTGLSPPGFATLVVSIFFLAGVQLVTIGVIGEYVGRIFEEVKRRPLYVLRQVKGGQD